MGKWSHRSEEQQKRIQGYLDLPAKNIESCYYHLGRTTSKSIFFISDAIPITDKYIESAHVGADNKHFIIKNSKLITELERKLFRILAYDNSRKGFFRQKFLRLKNILLLNLMPMKVNNSSSLILCIGHFLCSKTGTIQERSRVIIGKIQCGIRVVKQDGD